MKASIDKLRWALAGGSLVLLLLLIAVVGYGRYQAARLWKNRLDKLGVHIEQTTDNVTYSQTIQGRTVFTLRAGKAIQRKDGKTTLHNVQLTLYGKKDGSEDRIYGSEFEYDDKSGIARALGDVEMDLRVPQTLSKGGKSATSQPAGVADAQNTGRDIHVRTSGLTYVRKLGVAATDQQVMLSYAGLQCTAKGAEFDSGESIVHLLADVQLQGALHGKQVSLHAAKADLNHDNNSVTLANPNVRSGEESASATSAVLHLRHDGSVETAQAEGSVALQKLTRKITAARLDGQFSNDNVPQQASLTGGVNLVDTNVSRPMRGSANRVDGTFDAVGKPLKWNASGNAQLTSTVRGASGKMFSRKMMGDQIVASMKPGKTKSEAELSDLHIAGAAQVSAEASAPGGIKNTQIAADDLKALFDSGTSIGSPTLRQVTGTGHTRLQQDAPGGAQQISTANTLQMHFAPDAEKKGELQVLSATQDGDVKFNSRPAMKAKVAKQTEPVSAHADHSVYDGATENLTLTGNAQFIQGTTTVAANSLAVNQDTGDSDAIGNVLATLTPPEERTTAEATHIHAERAHLVRDTQTGVFRGSDAQPARLWQGPSQVEAATIALDGKKHLLTAQPDSPGASVHAVFASTASSASKTGSSTQQRSAQIERVAANRLDYDDLAHVATFIGNLHAQGTTGQVQAEHAQLYFASVGKTAAGAKPTPTTGFGSAPSMGGSLQRAVVWGDVRLSQPGKIGRGDKLVYTAADSTFILTGSPSHPPEIIDAERGRITGASLSFQSGDNTVLVSGRNPSVSSDGHGRVHTETGAKQ